MLILVWHGGTVSNDFWTGWTISMEQTIDDYPPPPFQEPLRPPPLPCNHTGPTIVGYLEVAEGVRAQHNTGTPPW